VFSLPPLTPFVKKLIFTLLGAFVLELVLQNFLHLPVAGWLALQPGHLGVNTVWQIVTYVLIEAPSAVISMLIGLFFMWMIMAPFEATFGPRRTMELSLAGTLGAALCVIAAAQVDRQSDYIFFGSHPIAYAGMAAMATVMQRGRMMFFGVIPMTSQQLLMVLVGLCVLQYLASTDFVMLCGSLGAIGAGVLYVKYMTRTPRPRRAKRTSGSRFRVVRGGAAGDSPNDGDRPKWLN
jgi:membrane associated rhomboid family serine protease